uniref:CSON014201 protein n=1 Tax=Culicoides sonorensis TaxID=179676 RepID=A0A336L0V2_CULSO
MIKSVIFFILTLVLGVNGSSVDFCTQLQANSTNNPLLITVPNITIKYSDQQLNNYNNKNLKCISIIGIVILLLITLISTTYDNYITHTKRKHKISKLLTSFSLKRNFCELMKENLTIEAETISCIDGIRTITVFSIVLLHINTEIIYFFAKYLHNPDDALKFSKSILFMMAQQGQMGVDTCFMLSGLCLTYNFMRKYEFNWKNFNLIEHYLHRYVRLTPSYLAALIFYTLVHDLRPGPTFNENNVNFNMGCHGKWIKTLSYLDTGDYFDSCLPQGWTIDADMKLYLMSPLILLPLLMFGYTFIPIILIIILITIVKTYQTVILYNFTAQHAISMQVDYMRKIYYPLIVRSGPWFIGVIAGFLLFEHRNIKEKLLSKIQVTLLWIVATISLISIICPMDFPPGIFKSVTYSSIMIPTYRIIWSTAMAWVVYACHHKYGNALNTFLSYPFWQIGAKLSYGVILIHYTLILLISKQQQTPVYFHEFHFFIMGLGVYLFSLLGAIPWTLVFEMPFRNLERELLWSDKNRKSYVKID